MDGRWVSWMGVASCGVATVFMLVGQAAGRRARLLQDAKQVGSLADLSALAHLLPVIIAITGRVCCSNPIKTEDESTSAAILQAAEFQHFMKQSENGEWKHDKVAVFNSVREVPWSLDDGSGVKVEVINGRSATGLVLSTVLDQYQPLGKSFFQYAADHFRGVKMLGITRTEKVLPVGTPITAVGELAAGMPQLELSSSAAPGAAAAVGTPGGPAGGSSPLVLRAPASGEPFYISTKSLPELLDSLSRLSRTCKYFAGGFGALGVYLLMSQAFRVATRELRRRRYRAMMDAEMQKQAARRAAAGGAEVGSAAVDDSSSAVAGSSGLCIVCLERPLDSVFAKCGHMCCCMSCASRLRQCPVCRQDTHIIRVYLP